MGFGLAYLGVLTAAILILGAASLAGAGPVYWSLASFTGHLAAVVRRNLPLGPAIEAYAAELPWLAGFKRTMLRTVACEVDNGRPLSEVMGCYPGAFPAAYRGVVRAGERAGNLGAVLGELRELAELDRTAARRVTAAALYPLFVAVVLGGGGSFSFVFIVPGFEMMFEEMGIINAGPLGLMLSAHEVAVGVLVVLGVLGLAAALWPLGALMVHRLAPALAARLRQLRGWLRWRLPGFRRYERRRAAGRFALVAGKLLGAGLPEVEALRIAAEAAGNARFERLAAAAAARVAEGRPLAEALAAEDPRGELPPELLWHARVGQAAGGLPAALERAAAGLLERADNALRGLTSLIFPAGIAALGVVVGLLAYSLFNTLVGLMEETIGL